ncbi:proline dehydrogenase family protein [Acidipila sp. EB88]|uniref:proline dehydrogenase family protein n=1 Tax=Acidipila sp. EB88 TaxID=2305226 RepID=UPI00268F25ED
MTMLRSTFISLSRNQPLRRFSEASAAGRRISSRFVAGLEIEDVLKATAALNRDGIAATLDSLGENVHTPEEAKRSAAIYHQLLDAIGERGLNANASVKLTQMGMDLSPGLAEQIVGSLVEHAQRVGTFLRVDMEGSTYTQATLDLVSRLHRQYPGSIGVVIQAYLRRSTEDVARLIEEGIRVRLCKGAYQEPATLAFPDKADVDANYVRLTTTLLASGLYHGIATHDPRMIDATRRIVAEQGLAKQSFEFQMLYGVRRDLQRSLVAEGYNMRVYVPFGHEWYPYFMRRLAERPANVLFLAKNFFRS